MTEFLHSFKPVCDPDCRILILGSMPGKVSLREQQYYAFPHNVFWRIMEDLFAIQRSLPYAQRLTALLEKHIALWDTLADCRREGSLDSNIREPVPNDIAGLLKHAPEIHAIFCNGTASYTLLKRCHAPLFQQTHLKIFRLPSTSPAAAGYSYGEKLAAWKVIIKQLRNGE